MVHTGENMKLSWVSAPPWAATGYGKVTRNFITRIKYPEEINVVTCGGLSTGPFVEWNGIKVYPGLSTDRSKGDIYITNLQQLFTQNGTTHWVLHNDAWAFRNTIGQIGPKFPCITYSPVDGGHVSQEEYAALNIAQERVAMCNYAEREIKRLGLSATNIPHGVDTKIYKPIDRDKARETCTLPKDEFVFGFVGTNISKRKGQYEMFEGLKQLWDTGRKFSVVMMTNINGQQSGGYDLYRLADYVGLPRHVLRFPTNAFAFSEEEMATWYNAFDVMLLLSRGEGFGIPILEAQACGTPVIGQDFSAMTELIEGHGILIPPKAFDCYTLKTQLLAIGNPELFAKECAKCIDSPDLVKSMGKRASKFTQKYDWDKIAPKWDRMFKRIDNEGFFPPFKIKEFK